MKGEGLRFEFEGNGKRKKLYAWKKVSSCVCGLGPLGQVSIPSQHEF